MADALSEIIVAVPKHEVGTPLARAQSRLGRARRRMEELLKVPDLYDP